MVGRRYLPVRISHAGFDAVKTLADKETGGNISEMIRRLLTEALAARARKREQ